MAANGVSRTMKELQIRSDLCDVSKCAACNRLAILCVCEDGCIASSLISIPESTLKTSIGMAVASDLSVEFL